MKCAYCQNETPEDRKNLMPIKTKIIFGRSTPFVFSSDGDIRIASDIDFTTIYHKGYHYEVET